MESRAFFLLAFVLCITDTRQQHLQNGADESSGYSGDNGIYEDDEKVTTTTATEGSGFGDEHLTPCQRLQRTKGRTECTSDGKFKPTQCRSGKCWCVDENGAKTSQPVTGVPDCSVKNRDRASKHTQRPVYAAPPQGNTVDDFILDESSTFRPMYSERSTSAKTSRVQSTMVAVAEKNAFLAFLLKDPLIFAGIVGGIVLALLCIVLAVMFTIYRMRKKDEGSYALDEPKKTYGFPYTRAEEKEFFA